jgi:DnaJ-class molecular chaperone
MSSNLPPNISEHHEQFNALPIPMKDCDQCMGTGIEMNLKLESEGYKKSYDDCSYCDGTGKIEMTHDEIREEIEASKEPKHDL